MTAAVEVDGLRRVYRVRGARADFVAVDDMSFTIPAGGSLAIVGESGSGKTTTARMLIGLERPSAGSIRLCGEDWSRPRRSSSARRHRGGLLQIVFQDPYTSLDPRQAVGPSIEEVLRLHTALDRPARAARVRELLDSVGLDERHLGVRPGALSGGQRQRVAIAKALAAAPAVLVLDEAVSALDVSVQAQVLNLLADIRRNTGVAYLFISHDLAVVRQIADEVLVLQHGRTVERGPVAQVLDEPRHPYTRLLRSSVPGPGWRPARVRPAGRVAT
jgi:ABC-type glutathione transport system ATPase component